MSRSAQRFRLVNSNICAAGRVAGAVGGVVVVEGIAAGGISMSLAAPTVGRAKVEAMAELKSLQTPNI